VFAQWWAFEAASCPRHLTLNEDSTLNLHVTPPLLKHFVACSGASIGSVLSAPSLKSVMTLVTHSCRLKCFLLISYELVVALFSYLAIVYSKAYMLPRSMQQFHKKAPLIVQHCRLVYSSRNTECCLLYSLDL